MNFCSSDSQFPEKNLILAVVEATVKDFLEPNKIPRRAFGSNEEPATARRRLYREAAHFLFDDEYRLTWGEWDISPSELLKEIDINLPSLRKLLRIRKKSLKKISSR